LLIADLTTATMSSGKPHKDIKSRTKNRLVSLDMDIGSQYDGIGGEKTAQGGKVKRDISGHKDRTTRQKMLGAGGNRASSYEVTIRSDAKCSVLLIIQSLYEIGGILPFNITHNTKKSRIRFFVCTADEAENLQLLNRRLSHSINPRDKFVIQYTQQPSPWDVLDLKLKMTIKDVVLSRYIPSTNAIDLSSFQADKLFAERGLESHYYLSRGAVLVEVVRVIAANFPNITGLSLVKNRLNSLAHIQSLTFACRDVVELDLSENSFKNVNDLRLIQYWKIQSLSLLNNPLGKNYSDLASYVSDVQTYLPHVTYLNGEVVMANKFKIEGDFQRRLGILFPPVQPNYFPDIGIKQRVEQLLIQFYDLYDGQPSANSRQLLVDAYDENATFTFSTGSLSEEPKKSKRGNESKMSKPADESKKSKRGDDETFEQYSRYSHNLCFEKQWENNRDQLVFKCPMAIAWALSQLPQTLHAKSVFSIEFITVRQQLLVFALQGVFRDGNDVQNPSRTLKFFSRTFTIVARGEEKLAIVNDALIIAQIDRKEFQGYNERLKKAAEAVTSCTSRSVQFECWRARFGEGGDSATSL